MSEPLTIAYVHYGAQSGVTAAVQAALIARGHRVRAIDATGPLEPREPTSRRLRLSLPVLRHLAHAGLRFGRRGLAHRWNTSYAFDVHTRTAGARLRPLAGDADVVLQNGALFGPGRPAPLPYVLLCDHTRALAQRAPPDPAAGLEAPPDYGPGWFAREREVYRGAAAVCAFSRNVAGSLAQDYDVRGAAVVGAGANVFPTELRRVDDGETLLFVGKDFVRKGGPVLLDAFLRVRRRRPSVRLWIAGPRERLALPPGVESFGLVSLAQVTELLARATVFVLPTLREPFGLAFLDAMACGVPCVGTRVEAVPEIVDEGRTGRLVPPGDPGALAAALLALLERPEEARAMGLAGRARVEASGRWSHVAARLEPLLRRAAVARAGPVGAAAAGALAGPA